MTKKQAKLIIAGGSLADIYLRYCKVFSDEKWTELVHNTIFTEARRVIAKKGGAR